MAQPDARKLLDPSELGTQEYWEAVYTRELQNNIEDESDEGVVWFEESNAEETVLAQLSTYRTRALLDPATCRFLDLGTGNGHMLFALREYEDDEVDWRWTGDMVGVDYSEKSVELARQLDCQRKEALNGTDADHATIRLEQWDLLNGEPGEWLQDGFHAVLDKGTFDAISLMSPDRTNVHPCDIYREKVEKLVMPDHFLFVTSCNWTRDELIGWLAPDNGNLVFFDEAKYPTFKFGGRTGQSVVTLVFRKPKEG